MESRSLAGRKYLDIEEKYRPLPPLGPVDVLVKVHACGVCGTDLNFLRDLEGDYQSMGHEIAGEILELGSHCPSHLAKGMRVIVEDCTMCGYCHDCKSGHPEFCRNMYDLQGMPGMGEYLVVRFSALHPFPETLSYTHAALTEPLAVAYNACSQAGIKEGESVLVMGTGSIGLLTGNVAKIFGASYTAIACRKVENPMQKARAALGEKLGLTLIETAKYDLEETIRSRFPKGVDHVIVTTPPETIADALKCVKYGGKITFLGLSFAPGKNLVSYDVNYALFNKITLAPSFAEPALNFPAALSLICEGKIPAELYQTHTLNFSNYKEIFGQMLKGEIPVIKGVFLPE